MFYNRQQQHTRITADERGLLRTNYYRERDGKYAMKMDKKSGSVELYVSMLWMWGWRVYIMRSCIVKMVDGKDRVFLDSVTVADLE